MPFIVAAGNSSGYNYASGRLDHQVYYKSIRVEQHHLQLAVLDRILKAWPNEAERKQSDPAPPHVLRAGVAGCSRASR